MGGSTVILSYDKVLLSKNYHGNSTTIDSKEGK